MSERNARQEASSPSLPALPIPSKLEYKYHAWHSHVIRESIYIGHLMNRKISCGYFNEIESKREEEKERQ